MADYKAKTNWLPDDPINEDDLNRWEAGIKAANEEGDEHRNNKQNPHGVTKAQLGLSQVENVRQASKVDFETHEKNKQNPHEVNKSQVGLGSVQNYPVASQAQAEAGTHTASYMTPQRTKQAIDIHNTLLNHISVLGLNALNFDVEPVDYPVGISYFYINSTDMKYPGQTVFITTFRDVDPSGQPRAFQTIQGIASNYNQMWTRGSRNGVWGDLIESESKAGAQLKVNAHENKKNNPHGVTKEQVGLANVTNDQQAKKVDHDAHVANKQNPHNVTTEQINVIGPVAADRPGSDYPNGLTMFQTASGESIGYPGNQIIVHTIRQGSHRCFQNIYDSSSNDDRVWYRTWRLDTGWKNISESESVEGAQLKVNAHENKKNNPHNVTKEQVGLSNVDNAQQATKVEFNSHLNDKSNPHNVTKAQVGLSNVVNYPVATQAQAEVGNHTASYMTPERVRQFVSRYGPDFDAFNGLALDHGSHKNNKNNPHNVTTEQVNNLDGNKSLTDPISSFPYGLSISRLPSGGPGNVGGILLTVRQKFSSTAGHQIFYPTHESLNDRHHVRYVSTSSSGWTSWSQYETTDGAQAKVNTHENKKNNPHGVTTEQVNNIAFKLATDLVGTYPTGITIFAISSHNNDVTGYPYGYGTVVTTRVHNSRTFQVLYGNGDTANGRRYWTRWAFEGVWTQWYEEGQTPLRWTRASLMNRWEQNGGRPIEYAKDSAGNIHIEGAMRNGIYGNPDAAAFILPEGYWPKKTRVINVASASGTISYTRVVIRDNGTVWVEDVSRAGAESYVDMSCTFPADR